MFKLLIVDDEKRTREGLKKCINWNNYGIVQIEEACDGNLAIWVAKEFKPDIIISDIMMPNMTGIDFATKIREHLPDCKIIFISGYTDKEYFKSAIKLKAVSYIEKPVNIEEINEAVRTAIQMCQDDLKIKNLKDVIISKAKEEYEIEKKKLAILLTEFHDDYKSLAKEFTHITNFNITDFCSFVTIIIKINNNEYKLSKQKIEHAENLLFRVIENHTHARKIFCLTGTNSQGYIICHLFCSSVTDNKILKALIESINTLFCDLLNTELNIDSQAAFNTDILKETFLSISTGLSVNSIEKLFLSYQTALNIIDVMLFLANKNIAFYKENKEVITMLDLQYSKEQSKKFYKLLVNESKENTLSFLNMIINDLITYNEIIIEDVKNLFFVFLLSVNNVTNKSSYSIDFPEITDSMTENKKHIWQIVANASTLSELKNILYERVEDYFKELDEVKNNKKITFDIINNIKSNYRNKHFSINYISKSLDFTPAYLCQNFKRDMGETINNYLNKYRIEKAKELITKENLKFYEVADYVGYSDEKYFSKIFKKITGVTPAVFKNEYLKGKF